MSNVSDLKEAEKNVEEKKKIVYETGRQLGMTDEEIAQDLREKGLE
jgi:hypothetical protein